MKSITEVKLMPPGEKVDAIRGFLLSHGPHQTKNRPDGEPYTVQSFVLSDGKDRIEGVIYDHFPVDTHLGKELIFCSMKSRNGRYGGVTTVLNTGSGSLFSRRNSSSGLSVSKAGALHTPDTYATLCATTKRND